MPPRNTRSFTRKVAASTPAAKGKNTANSSKSVGRVFKSADIVENSGDEFFQTPPPRPAKGVPSTPKQEKRKMSLRSPETALELESAPSPSPTKKMRTLAVDDSPKKNKSTAQTNSKAVPNSRAKAIFKAKAGAKPMAKASTRGKSKVKSYVSDEEDEEEDEEDDDDVEIDSEEDQDQEENEGDTDAEDGEEDVVSEEDNDKEELEDSDNQGEDEDEDNLFATLGAGRKPNAKKNLKDTRNIRVKVLPKTDAVPSSVYDEGLMKRKPNMTFHNLKFGDLATWKTQNSKDNTMTLASMAFYQKFTQDKVVISNILNGLSFEEDQPFYNAATADPRNFVARYIPSNLLTQYELISAKTGEPVVGIAVASFVRSTLRGPVPDKQHYCAFSVIPHRGWYERFASFHCMNFGVDTLLAQQDDSVLSFQTRSRSDDSQKADDKDEEDISRKTKEAFSDLEAYESPKKKATKALRRHLGSSYKFDKEVHILDGRGVKLNYTCKGLYDHLDSLPEFTGNITLKSPCVVGYNTYGYIYKDVWKVKFNILFVIVLDVAQK